MKQNPVTSHPSKYLYFPHLAKMYIGLLPVAQRAKKVWACFLTKACRSRGRESRCRMRARKSWAITAARSHLSFPRTSTSQSWCLGQRGWSQWLKKGRVGSKAEMSQGRKPIKLEGEGPCFWVKGPVLQSRESRARKNWGHLP